MGTPEVLKDEQLVQRVRAGQLEPFEQLLSRHLEPIRVFAAFHAPSSLKGVDPLVRTTFVVALQNLHLFTPGTEFRGWLRAIAWQLIQAEYKRVRAEGCSPFEAKRLNELEREPVNPYSDQEVDFLDASLHQLPDSLQSLVREYYHENRSTQQIAQRLERKVSAVQLLLLRLRQELARKTKPAEQPKC